MRKTHAAVQVKEEINDLEVAVEDLAGPNLRVSEGRFDFDARVELVFHGLDPPGSATLSLSDLLSAPGPQSLYTLDTSGTLFVALPVVSTESSQPTLSIDITSEDVFDPTRLHLAVDDPQNVILTQDESEDSLVVGASETLKGSGTIEGDVFIGGLFSPGNSPGIVTITGDLTIASGDPDTINDAYTPPAGSDTVGRLEIEIGGLTPGPGPAGDINNGYDQIIVNGLATLGGTVNFTLINNLAISGFPNE